YPLAEQVAREWQRDAELRSVRATWQNAGPAELRQGKNSWAFYFVSPSSKTGAKMLGYIVSVNEGRAEGVKAGEVTSNDQSLSFVDWKVDSPQALRVFLENGGQDFLARHAQADAHAILKGTDSGQQPVWEVTLLDKQTKDTLSLQLDAATGQVKR
ncbi:MAG: hypothetical protein Q7O66_22005, partial [Dehalococcoidia bacterium]|nr:hypothetical protein [Dehalococcoidia bacterium]